MSLRTRLTALYAGLFGLSAALLLGVVDWLVSRHLRRTLPADVAASVESDFALQLLLALLGTLLVAVAVGWVLAARALAPLERIRATAARVSAHAVGERVRLEGSSGEVREVADAMDAMLDRLEESLEAQKRFVANASHELRGPLTVIRTEADVALADPDAGEEDLRAMARAVIEGSERAEALLEGLLLLARSQRGLLRRETLELGDAARVGAAHVGPEASGSEISVKMELGPAPVEGDRRLLERVLANLVENAVRYNRHGGEVSVRTWTEGEWALAEVRNSGPLLSAEDVGRMTEPFERLGRRADGRGSGLGLSIARTVAEAHGGRLELAPGASGGAIARVRLPVA